MREENLFFKILAFIRSVIVTCLFPFTVIIMGPSAIILHLIFRQRKIDDAMISAWGRLCCWMSGVTVHVSGLDNSPHKSCLYLFNHSSFFDVFALAGYVPGIRFGAKAELFNIPIFGHTMKVMGTLPIKRTKRDEVYKVYEEAKSRFTHGETFALSPEGGRFYSENLSPFKAGPFLFAMSAGVPVVPVVITGAYEVLPKGGFLFNKNQFRAKIKLQILKPIETKSYTYETRSELQKLTYDAMNPIWLKSRKAASGLSI